MRYLFNDVTDPTLFCAPTFTCFIFGLLFLFFIVDNGVLDSHKFMQDHDVLDFFGLDPDSVLVVQVIIGVDFDIFTQGLDPAVHVQLTLLQVVVDLFVWVRGNVLSKDML